jgi:DNA invertase Pin-like site-specific DNA recombinase
MSDKFKAAVYCRVVIEETPKAAIYCRIASAADEFAIKAQEKMLRDYAAEKMLAVGEVYSDNGASGLSLNRPAFQEMMSAVKHGEINCVIVKSICRISRDTLQFGKWLDDMRGRNVRVIAVTDSYDSHDTLSLFGTMFRDYIEQMVKADMSDKIKRGIAHSRQRKLEQAAKIYG